MLKTVTVGEIKKPRSNRDILRCLRNSVKKGQDNSFSVTSTMKEIVVVISAAIGNTSFRNSGIRPMNYRYPSVGSPLFISHAWDMKKYIIKNLLGQIKEVGAGHFSTGKCLGQRGGGHTHKKQKSNRVLTPNGKGGG